MKIGYLDDPQQAYSAALTTVQSLGELRLLTEKYRRIADDAYQCAQKMDDSAFVEFISGLRKERRGKFAGEKYQNKYADILMPATMFHVALIANQYKVPWGLAFIRAKEGGLITEQDSVATWKRK